MKVEYINCENCGKVIQKRNNRVLCIACRNIKDKERIRARTQTDEYKRIHREKYRLKKEGLL
jgi:Zn finger protein HypA/HybF involved in hydrogenase expression